MQKPWYSRLYIKSYTLKLVIGIVSVGGGIVLLGLMFFLEPPRMDSQEMNWEGRSVENGADLYINNCSSCHGPEGQGGAGPALNSRYFFVQRLDDLDYKGTQSEFIKSTVASGRPSKTTNQWNQVMATWSSEFGGPFRQDQVDSVAQYVMNWESTALQQTIEEDPWIPFDDTSSRATVDEVYPDAEPVPEEEREPRSAEELFTSMGCIGCHNLAEMQTDTNRGPVGPNMGNLASSAALQIEGMSAHDYIVQSIIEPNSYVVDGYNPNIMTPTFAEQMTEEEMNSLADWLISQTQ